MPPEKRLTGSRARSSRPMMVEDFVDALLERCAGEALDAAPVVEVLAGGEFLVEGDFLGDDADGLAGFGAAVEDGRGRGRGCCRRWG